MASFLNNLFASPTKKLENSFKENGLPKGLAITYAKQFSDPENSDLVISNTDHALDLTDLFSKMSGNLSGKRFRSITFDNADRANLSVMEKLNLSTDNLTLKNCSDTHDRIDSLMNYVAGSKMESVSIENTFMSQDTFKVFAASIDTISYLKTLNLDQIYVQNPEAILPVISSLPLESLSFSYCNRLDKKYLGDVIDALPPSLKSLNLSSLDSARKTLVTELLEKKLPQLQNLESLDLSSSSLEDQDILRLLPVLPKKLKTFNIKNSYITEASFKALTEHLTHPDTILHTTNALKRSSKRAFVTPETQRNFGCAEAKNTKKFYTEKNQEPDTQKPQVAQMLDQAQTEKDIKGLFHKALSNGLGDKIFDKMIQVKATLQIDDLTNKDTSGNTVVEECQKRRLTHRLMNPVLYDNANTYQAVFDGLSESNKKKFDGIAGRLSFSKMKQSVMVNAVKATLRAKKALNR